MEYRLIGWLFWLVTENPANSIKKAGLPQSLRFGSLSRRVHAGSIFQVKSAIVYTAGHEPSHE